MSTPSETIIAAANQTTAVKDARGRLITVRKLNALDRLHLFEIVGSDNVKNESYFGYATLAYSVSKIDEEDLATPRSKITLEAAVGRLDTDGLAAAGLALVELTGDAVEGNDTAKN